MNTSSEEPNNRLSISEAINGGPNSTTTPRCSIEIIGSQHSTASASSSMMSLSSLNAKQAASQQQQQQQETSQSSSTLQPTGGGNASKCSTLSVMRFTKLTPIVSCENLADMDQQQQQQSTSPSPPPPSLNKSPSRENSPVANGLKKTLQGLTSGNIMSSSTKKTVVFNSHIKRMSSDLIESMTRVNVSDGILASGVGGVNSSQIVGGGSSGGASSPNQSLKHRDTISMGAHSIAVAIATSIVGGGDVNGRQLRSASACSTTAVAAAAPAVASLDNLVAFPIAVLGSSSSTDNDNEPISAAASVDYNSDEDTTRAASAAVGTASLTSRAKSPINGKTSSPMRYLAARNATLASSNSSLNGSLSSATSTASKLTVNKT